MSENFNGNLLCTISLDKSLKIFDFINFDMINMIRLDYVTQAVSFIHSDHVPCARISHVTFKSSLTILSQFLI